MTSNVPKIGRTNDKREGPWTEVRENVSINTGDSSGWMCGHCGPFLPCITVTHATTLAVTTEEHTVWQPCCSLFATKNVNVPICAVMAVYTFSCIVGQDRTSPCLLSLRVLSRAGVWAVRPGGPGTQRAVLWTRHLADDRHGQNGVAAQLLFHILPWMDRRTFHSLGKLIPDPFLQSTRPFRAICTVSTVRLCKKCFIDTFVWVRKKEFNIRQKDE